MLELSVILNISVRSVTSKFNALNLRYLTNTDQSCLSTLYYRRAVEMDADVGQAFNQLALNETPTNSVRLVACTSVFVLH